MAEKQVEAFSVLSRELLPNPPQNVTPEMQKYIRDLHEYLRRLVGRFTADNGLGLPQIPDYSKDYILGYDSVTKKLRWVETTSSCPTTS